MTHRAPTTAALLAALLVLLPGCADDVPAGPDAGEVVAADEARLDLVAADLQRRPGVECVNAFLDSDGLPDAQPGLPTVISRTRGLEAAQRDALVRETAAAVWAAGLSRITSVRVEVLGPSGSSDLGLLLQGRTGRVDEAVLERELGPRPTPSSPAQPLPQASGATGC